VVVTVKDYKRIRQMHLTGISQREIAKQLHISRRTVKKYCEGCAVPWERKVPEREPSVLTEEAVNFIKSCIAEDENEHLKKQTHTAKRIYDRLVDEKGFTGGESTVRRKVREIKARLPEVYIPLEFSPGEAVRRLGRGNRLSSWRESYSEYILCQTLLKLCPDCLCIQTPE